MSFEHEIGQISKELDQLSADLDRALAKSPIAGSDLQRIGQKEKELSEWLGRLEKIAKQHTELSAATADSRLKAASIRRRL